MHHMLIHCTLVFHNATVLGKVFDAITKSTATTIGIESVCVLRALSRQMPFRLANEAYCVFVTSCLVRSWLAHVKFILSTVIG